MRTSLKVFLPLLAVVCGLLIEAGQAQSLGELARQERAKRKTSTTSKTYTNDDIPEATLSGAPPAGEAGAATEAKPGEGGEKSPADLEKEYREKAAKLKEALQYEERRLDVQQRELSLAQQQFYSDPNVALREQNTREEINKRTEEIEKQKAAVEKAKQAITDLEEELKKKSLPPGWARD